MSLPTHTDVMLDMEFLSLEYRAVIMSVGLFFWDQDSHWREEPEYFHSYYASVKINEQLDKGRKISEDTFRWWFEHDEARDSIHRGRYHPISVEFVLSAILDLSKMYRVKRVWSHGAACDVPMLWQLFDEFGIERPWGYRQVRDTRTLFEIYETLINKSPEHNDEFQQIQYWLKPEGKDTSHHSLEDAKNQARAVYFIWNRVMNGTLGPKPFTP